MNDRQEQLLQLIIERYVKTAQPVSSQAIVGSEYFDLSSATIRNDMAELEAGGYIAQPHTSSGRIPTEKGFRYYVSTTLAEREQQLASRQRQQMDAAAVQARQQHIDLLREVVNVMAGLSVTTSFAVSSDRGSYYTGLSHLFRQPEFIEHELVYQVSSMVERLDEIAERMIAQADERVTVLLGRENPFGVGIGTIFVNYRTPSSQGIVGLIGPLRMDYQRNISIVRHARNLIHNISQ